MFFVLPLFNFFGLCCCVQFFRTLGSAGNDQFYKGREIDNGAFIVGGEYDGKALVSRYNDNGNITFMRTYMSGKIYDVQQTRDFGYIAAGETADVVYGGSKDLTVFKLDPDGVLIFARRIGGNVIDSAYTIIEVEDSGYFVVGKSSSSFGSWANQGSYDICCFKLHENGSVHWATIFGTSGTDYPYGAVESDDGGFVIVGNSKGFGRGLSVYDSFIVKLNSNGNVETTKYFGVPVSGDLMIYDLKKVSDGYIVGGTTTGFSATIRDGIILKFDFSLGLVFAKRVQSTQNVNIWSVSNTTDGKFVLGGYYLTNALLIKVDPQTNSVDYARKYGDGTLFINNHIQQTSNGDYALFGMTYGFGGAGGGDAFFLKTDYLGNAPCGGLADLACTLVDISPTFFAPSSDAFVFGHYASFSSSANSAWYPTTGDPFTSNCVDACVAKTFGCVGSCPGAQIGTYPTCGPKECYGKNQSENWCSGHGDCISDYFHCDCNQYYEGDHCNLTICNGKWNTDPNICSSHGSCITSEVCNCDDYYFGDNCEVTSCFGIWNNDTVCSGHGSCFNHDECECFVNFTSSSDCNTTTCYGILSNDSDVCGGFGVCTSYDTCKCDVNGFLYGPFCNTTECWGITDYVDSDDPDVCNGGHGECVYHRTCKCDENYFGLPPLGCGITTCGGVFSNMSVCSGHGDCWPFEICQCSDNYYGEKCNITKCGGIYSNETNICFGRGTCTFFEECDCDDNYFGDQCNITSCNDVYSNETSICSDHGECYVFEDCQCDDNYYGISCNITKCNDILSNITELVCSNRGKCNVFETCQCNDKIYGDNCNITKCNGIFTNDTQKKVCGGHGSCSLEYSVCQCDDHYYGKDCNVTICNDIFSNQTDICSKKGTCDVFEECQCNQDYYGSNCNITICNSIYSNDSDVCNSHGVCVDSLCNCDDLYFEEFCNVTTCGSFFSNDSRVCSKHGNCISFGNCKCNDKIYGDDCEITSCNSIPSNSSLVCGSHGNCSSYDHCDCDTGYFGEQCNITSCDGVFSNYTSVVCSGKGVCLNPGNCKCDRDTGYFGTTCQERLISYPDDFYGWEGRQYLFIKFSVKVSDFFGGFSDGDDCDITKLIHNPTSLFGDDFPECKWVVTSTRRILGGDYSDGFKLKMSESYPIMTSSGSTKIKVLSVSNPSTVKPFNFSVVGIGPLISDGGGAVKSDSSNNNDSIIVFVIINVAFCVLILFFQVGLIVSCLFCCLILVLVLSSLVCLGGGWGGSALFFLSKQKTSSDDNDILSVDEEKEEKEEEVKKEEVELDDINVFNDETDGEIEKKKKKKKKRKKKKKKRIKGEEEILAEDLVKLGKKKKKKKRKKKKKIKGEEEILAEDMVKLGKKKVKRKKKKKKKKDDLVDNKDEEPKKQVLFEKENKEKELEEEQKKKKKKKKKRKKKKKKKVVLNEEDLESMEVMEDAIEKNITTIAIEHKEDQESQKIDEDKENNMDF